MDTLLTLGLNNALAATVLALLVAGLSWILRRPALTHRLWLLVLLKLLTPPLWFVAIPWPLGLESTPAVADRTLPEVQAHSAPAARWHEERPVVPIGEAAIEPAELPASPPPVPDAPSGTSSWRSVAAALWLMGSLLWLVLAGWRIGRFHRLLRATHPAPPALQMQVRRLAECLGLARSPTVYLVAAPIPPLLWALGRKPRLLVPATLWEELTEAQQETLLVHELAHLRRRDHWVRGLELAVLAVYWWHPVVWWARRELHEAEEQCCDAWVVWALPGAAPAYATALLATVAFLSQTRPVLPATASGMGHVNVLKRRLTMILQGSTSRALSWCGFLVVLGLGVVLLPMLPRLGQLGAESPVPLLLVTDELAEPPAAAPQLVEPKRVDKSAERRFIAPPTVVSERDLAEQLEQAQDEVELLKVQLEVKQAQFQVARTGLDQAKERLGRLQSLQKQGAVSTEQVEQTRHEVAMLEAQFFVKAAEIEEPKLRLKQAQRRLERLQSQAGTPKTEPRSLHKTASEPKPANESTRLRELERKLDQLLKEMEILRRELRPQRPEERKSPPSLLK